MSDSEEFDDSASEDSMADIEMIYRSNVSVAVAVAALDGDGEDNDPRFGLDHHIFPRNE